MDPMRTKKLEGDKFGRKSTSHCCWFCWLVGGLTLHSKFSLSIIIQGKINESSDRLGSRELGESVDHIQLETL